MGAAERGLVCPGPNSRLAGLRGVGAFGEKETRLPDVSPTPVPFLL